MTESYLDGRGGGGGGGGGGTHVPTMFLLRIPSACESVYREIFVPHRKTVRLPSKSGVSRQNRKT